MPAGVVGHGANRETTDPTQEQKLAEDPRRLLVVVRCRREVVTGGDACLSTEAGPSLQGIRGTRFGSQRQSLHSRVLINQWLNYAHQNHDRS